MLSVVYEIEGGGGGGGGESSSVCFNFWGFNLSPFSASSAQCDNK
jgi:hypothetical protein